MKKNKILILGSLAFDYIMGFKEKFVNAVSINHEKEEYQSTITADSRHQHFGGTAGNIGLSRICHRSWLSELKYHGKCAEPRPRYFVIAAQFDCRDSAFNG